MVNNKTRVNLIKFYQENSDIKSYSQFAIDFLNQFKESYFSDYNISLIENDLNNFSIASENVALDFLTKRLSLISNTGIISHFSNKWEHFKSNINSNSGWGAINENIDAYYVDCPNLEGLGKWLVDCSQLIITGQIRYYPRIKVSSSTEISGVGIKEEFEIYDEDEYFPEKLDAIIRNRKLVSVETKNVIKSKFIRTIISVELPVIENIPLKQFSILAADEKLSLDILRDFLRVKFLELEENEGSESFDANIMKLGLDIKNGIRLIKSDFKNLSSKTAFQATGATIASSMATLIAINSAAFESWGKIVGASGGLFVFFKALEANLEARRKLKNSPYYYFWLLNKKAK